MSPKTLIYIGIAIGGIIGGYIGAKIDHNNFLGLWSILLTALGNLAGIWAGFKLSSNI